MITHPGFFYRKLPALIFMVLCILAACVTGSWRPMNRAIRNLDAMFWGEDGDTVSIYEDIQAGSGYFSNLILIAQKYNVEVRLSEEEMKAPAGSSKEAYLEAYRIRQEHALKMIISFDPVLDQMSETDRNALDSLHSRLLAQEDLIHRNVQIWNHTVEEYSVRYSGFPISMFRALLSLQLPDPLSWS